MKAIGHIWHNGRYAGHWTNSWTEKAMDFMLRRAFGATAYPALPASWGFFVIPCATGSFSQYDTQPSEFDDVVAQPFRRGWFGPAAAAVLSNPSSSVFRWTPGLPAIIDQADITSYGDTIRTAQVAIYDTSDQFNRPVVGFARQVLSVPITGLLAGDDVTLTYDLEVN